MHRCLLVSEILARILEFRPPIDLSYGGDHSEGFVAMARTCKTFYEPSMDIMYRCIPCLSVMFRCLPRDLWYCEREDESDSDSDSDSESLSRPKYTFYLRRYPTSREWALVERNTRRVKELEQDTHYFQDIQIINSSSVMEAIGRRCISRGWDQDPSKAFLPNLIKLAWSCEFLGASDPTLLHLPVIPGPWLRSFSFWDAHAHLRDPISSGIVSKSLMTCIKAQKYIKDLVVDRSSLRGWDGLHLSLPSLITHLQALRRFSCSGHDVNYDTIDYLSRLPGLEYIYIPISYIGGDSIFQTTASSNFLELTHLRLKAPNLKSSVHLLNFINSTKLAHIHLDYSAARPVKSDVAELFDTLRRHPLVETLTIEDDDANLEMNNLVDPDRTITSPIFDPLLRLPNLAFLKIDLKTGINIDDTTIIAMAKAWPQIIVFSIIPGKPLSTPPQVTLSGVAFLTKECPSFLTLELAFSPFYNPALPYKARSADTASFGRFFDLSMFFWAPIDDIAIAIGDMMDIFSYRIFKASVCPVGRPRREVCEQWRTLEEFLQHPCPSWLLDSE